MRFKKYILLSLVLCGFAACSDDNEIEIPKAPVLEKAQLALAIKSYEGRRNYSNGCGREYANGWGVWS